MGYKLKDDAEPILRVDEDTFYEQLKDPSVFGGKNKFWGLPKDAFRKDPQGIVLKSEYATQFEWNVDEHIKEIKMININVAKHPTEIEGMNVGAFCSWIPEEKIKNASFQSG